MKRHLSALVVARSGQLLDSLRVLLAAIPQIKAVHQADNISSALDVAAGHQLDLALLDFDPSGDGTLLILEKIKSEWLHVRCIVLIDNEQDRMVVESAGADIVLVKGVLASRLLAIVEELITES